MPRRLTPPLRGAANNTALVDTPESFCPPDNLRNVRPYGSGSQERPRMGPRPGLIKAFANQLGGGNRIQALTVVGRASGVSGYEPGEVTEVTGGTSRTGTTLAGCCWALDPQRGMFADFGTGYAYGVSWHPTLTRLAYFIITTSGGKTVTRVRYCDADTSSGTFGTDLWETDCEDKDPGDTAGTFPIYGNHILVDDTFTYVCAGPWLYVLRTSDGVYLQRYNMMGWSEECMSACIRHDGKLCVAFRGTGAISGPVTTNIADTGAGNGEGSHFRSGVMLFTVDETDTDVDDDMLTETQFGTKRTATAVTITGASWTAATKRLVKTGAFTSYTHATGKLIKITGGTGITAGSRLIASKISNNEIELVSSIGASNASDVTASELQPIWYEDHLYWRASEHVAMQPRGRYCNSIAALPDGGIVIATCNKGWGPNSTYAPDSTIAPRTVIKLNSSGVLQWEADFASRLDAYPGSWGTYYNDIPHASNANNSTNDPHPSADAIAVDPNGDIYVAGRSTAAGYSVHKIRGTDGAVLWETNTGDWAAQNGIAYDEINGVLAVAGKRNTTWEGSGGANAHLWFLDPANGEILDSYDLGETSINAWGVSISADGDTAYATDKVT